jgi:GT2 family glycosyltransferase
MIDLAVAIINYNTKKLTLECLQSVYRSDFDGNFDVFVLDNGSADGFFRVAKKKFPKIKLIRSGVNLGFAKGNNLLLKKAYKTAKYCLLLNSDTRVNKKTLKNLVAVAQKDGFDILSAKLTNADKSLQANAGNLPYFGYLFSWLSGLDDVLRKLVYLPSYQERNPDFYNKTRKAGWVSGCAMLIKATTLAKIGFLDEKLFMYGEDVDFCWRAQKKGLSVGWTDRSTVVHLGGASYAKPQYNQWMGEFRALIYLYKKHYNLFSAWFLKILIMFFVFVRTIAFFVMGKPNYSKTYAKIITKI